MQQLPPFVFTTSSKRAHSDADSAAAKRVRVQLPGDLYPADFSHIVTPASPDMSGLLLNMTTRTRIARGNSAIVYSARAASVDKQQTVTVRSVAVKKFSDDDDGLTAEDSFDYEADALERVGRHPHVAQLLGSVATAPDYMLVSELCVGGTLDTAIRRRPDLCQQNARLWTKQMLGAVAHCHALGVIHCDLKPHNMLLDGDNNLKVCDFGIAEVRDVINGLPEPFTQKRGYVITTRQWRAPEVLLSQCYAWKMAAGMSLTYGYQCDIWSLGVVLAELVGTLRCVYDTDNYADVMQLASVLSVFTADAIAAWAEARPFLQEHAAAKRDFAAFNEAARESGMCAPGWSDHVRFREKGMHRAEAVYFARTERMSQPEQCVGLLRQMLALVPEERPTAARLLEHEFFKL